MLSDEDWFKVLMIVLISSILLIITRQLELSPTILLPGLGLAIINFLTFLGMITYISLVLVSSYTPSSERLYKDFIPKVQKFLHVFLIIIVSAFSMTIFVFFTNLFITILVAVNYIIDLVPFINQINTKVVLNGTESTFVLLLAFITIVLAAILIILRTKTNQKTTHE